MLLSPKTYLSFTGFIGLAAILLLVQSCGSAEPSTTPAMDPSPPFDVKDAYVREWLGGSRDAGRGWEFFVQLEGVDQETQLDSVFYGKMSGRLQPVKQESNLYKAALTRVARKGVVMDSDPLKEAANVPPESSRFELTKGNAILGYRRRGVGYFTRVKDVRQADPIAYPGGGPKERQR